jgi:metal-responsive CopG/Arc/MetJ family transcriptional regulator
MATVTSIIPTQVIETANVRLPEGTIDRIEKVLKGGELRSGFIRTAVEAELRRRERDAAR